MAETVIGTANELAVKHYSVTLHAETLRASKFLRMMSGRVPKERAALAKTEKIQSTPDMPIITVTDLEKSAGDRVTCDMFHITSGLPFMGDRKIEGRGQPLSFATDEMKINQTRFPISPGSRMSQKRTKHNLRRVARANMANYFARLNDQLIMCHLAGARGYENTVDWVVPLESHAEFADICINPILPPTSNRRFYAGGKTSAANIGSTDPLTLDEIDIISATLKEMPLPPTPIEVRTAKGEDMGDPVWCLFVTERQWHYILTAAGGNNSATWRQFVADATRRGMLSNHPLFLGEAGIWNNILIKKYPRPVRFPTGSNVKEMAADGTVSTVQTAVDVDRAILVGGQALAIANGSMRGMGRNGFPTMWSEKSLDHGNTIEIAAGFMDGKKKLRFKHSDGVLTDYGCGTIDTYAPAPNSTAGASLRTTLRS